MKRYPPRADHGPHTEAKASDILISGERAMFLFEKARDRLQRNRSQSEGAAPQTVRACGHSGSEGVIE